jgi:hypothetical protein
MTTLQRIAMMASFALGGFVAQSAPGGLRWSDDISVNTTGLGAAHRESFDDGQEYGYELSKDDSGNHAVVAVLGSANYGSLHARCFARAYGHDAAAHGDSLYVSFGDVLTINSLTLPPGTPAQVHFRVQLEDMLTRSTAGEPNQAQAWTNFYFDTERIGISENIDHPAGSHVAELDAHVILGGTYGIAGELSVGAIAYAFDSDTFSRADALNTATFQVTSLTDGVYFTSASGHDYTVLAPEPTNLVLLGIGTVGLLAQAQRWRKTYCLKLAVRPRKGVWGQENLTASE